MTKDTGGLIFPELCRMSDGGKPWEYYTEGGITLLDYYAGEAMKEIQRQTSDAHKVAVLAYEQAEEMVKEKRRLENG